MAFNDLLSTSFLFSVAIIIILIGGIFAYVSYRMSEQDHKITSMVGLISTMAEELQFFRSKLSQSQEQQGGLQQQQQQHVTEQRHTIPVLDPNNLVTGVTTLISVSDDESGSDNDSESDSDSESDDDLESESEKSESDDENYELDEIVDLEEQLQMKESTNKVDEKIEEDKYSDINNIKSIHLEEAIDLNCFEHEHDLEHEHMEELLSSDLKTISITDLEDTNKKTDYKKMSITKLREEVVKNGIVIDASKLKKGELLKLLGDE
jgi:hypothetical protein